jgi:hypothetical protein
MPSRPTREPSAAAPLWSVQWWVPSLQHDPKYMRSHAWHCLHVSAYFGALWFEFSRVGMTSCIVRVSVCVCTCVTACMHERDLACACAYTCTFACASAYEPVYRRAVRVRASITVCMRAHCASATVLVCSPERARGGRARACA